MNSKMHIQNIDLTDSTPQWMLEIIRLTADRRSVEFAEFCRPERQPISLEKKQRCLAAADEAMALAKLQLEQNRIGFRPLSLPVYLQQLAQSAGVALATISAGDDTAAPFQQAAALANLAREIGLNLNQTWLHFRIGMAELIGHELVFDMSRRSAVGSSGNNLEKQCEQTLSGIESGYNDLQRQEYRRMKAELEAIFSKEA